MWGSKIGGKPTRYRVLDSNPWIFDAKTKSKKQRNQQRNLHARIKRAEKNKKKEKEKESCSEPSRWLLGFVHRRLTNGCEVSVDKPPSGSWVFSASRSTGARGSPVKNRPPWLCMVMTVPLNILVEFPLFLWGYRNVS